MTNKISSIQEEIKILKILIRLDMINELKVLFSKNYIYKKNQLLLSRCINNNSKLLFTTYS